MELSDYGISENSEYGNEHATEARDSNADKLKYTIDDFEQGRTVGEGAYGTVRLAKLIATGD